MTLHELVKTTKNGYCEKLKQYYETLESYGNLTEEQEMKFKNLKEKAEKWLLAQADVICTTCITSFDKRLKDFQFETVLIDEVKLKI